MDPLTPARIKALRQRLGLSLRQIAPLVGVHYSTWSRWEAGEREPEGSSAILLRMLERGAIGPRAPETDP